MRPLDYTRLRPLVKALYDEGLSNRQIKLELNLSSRAVRVSLQMEGLPSRKIPKKTEEKKIEVPPPIDYTSPVKVYIEGGLTIKKYHSGIASGDLSFWTPPRPPSK